MKPQKNELFQKFLKRFKRSVKRSGVLQEYKDRMYYTKPSQKKRSKRKAAIKRNKNK